MKERPILFSAPMVKAILDGRKTQTRRVCTTLPSDYKLVSPRVGEDQFYASRYIGDLDGEICFSSKYGKPGDRLWVRETLAADQRGMFYFADNVLVNVPDSFTMKAVKEKLPSMFMPRWASRITLEITNVRVERLQAISEEDAKDEGVEPDEVGNLVQLPEGWIKPHGKNGFSFPSFEAKSYAAGFLNLWDRINGKKYPWSSNPWVWIVEFKKI